ncbi:MAG TPA: ADP-ribosylation factor-like protein [candidate division Zixibacteria bacterium]|nr:ADP-ribosylation factor-like protein [candidate division Zixibacteria bacterium]
MQTQEQELEIEKVLITGIDNAGKSSIQDVLKFLPMEVAQRRVPSRELEIIKKNFLKKNFVFFIPPGQEDLRINELHDTMRNEYFENVKTFIFVLDSAAADRLDEAREELQKSIEDLLDLSPECNNFLFFAHKQDIENALSALNIKNQLLEPLAMLYPGVIKKFKIFETTIVSPESIFEPFVKAIAKHVGTNRIDFDEIAEWIRKQVNARIVLVTDHDGLLIGESYTGEENSAIYAAYVAKVFSAIEDYQMDLEAGGIKIIVLEDEDDVNYSIISRINCTRNDYLALLIGYPKTQIGMTRIINKKGLLGLKEAYENYKI